MIFHNFQYTLDPRRIATKMLCLAEVAHSDWDCDITWLRHQTFCLLTQDITLASFAKTDPVYKLIYAVYKQEGGGG